MDGLKRSRGAPRLPCITSIGTVEKRALLRAGQRALSVTRPPGAGAPLAHESASVPRMRRLPCRPRKARRPARPLEVVQR